jgi:hypothetical protein
MCDPPRYRAESDKPADQTTGPVNPQAGSASDFGVLLFPKWCRSVYKSAAPAGA